MPVLVISFCFAIDNKPYLYIPKKDQPTVKPRKKPRWGTIVLLEPPRLLATTGGMLDDGASATELFLQQSCSYKMVYLGAVRFLAYLLCYHYATFRTRRVLSDFWHFYYVMIMPLFGHAGCCPIFGISTM